MQYVYPAIFRKDKTMNDTWAVEFPDVEGGVTCGYSLYDALLMAEDVLNLSLWDLEENGKQDEIPTPTPLDKVVLKPNETVRMIYADTEVYAKKVAEQLKREEIETAANPIKAVRESKGWTIKEFADFLHAPYRTIQDWNAGKTQPPKWIATLIIDKVQSA